MSTDVIGTATQPANDAVSTTVIRTAIETLSPHLRVYAENLSLDVDRAESADDLLQAGILHVLLAEHRYDPERGKPLPFVMRRAKNGMIDHLRSIFGRRGTRSNRIRLPRSLTATLENDSSQEPATPICPAQIVTDTDERQRQTEAIAIEAERFAALIAEGMTVSAAAHRLGLTALQMQAMARYLGLRPPRRRNLRPAIAAAMRKYLVMPEIDDEFRLTLIAAFLDGVALVASLTGEPVD